MENIFNNNYSNNIEDLLSKGYSSKRQNSINDILSNSIQSRPSPPNFEYMFSSLKELSAGEDNFDVILRRIQSIANKANRHGKLRRAEIVIGEAHEIYIITQKTKALEYAEQGDFDRAYEHFTNAHISIGGALKLDQKITEEEADVILDTAFKNVDPAYLWFKLEIAAEQGNVDDAGRYASFTLKALSAQDYIELPTKENLFEDREVKDPKKFLKYIEVQKEVKNLHYLAYQNAFRNHISISIGYAIQHPNLKYTNISTRSAIEKTKEQIKEAILDRVEELVPRSLESAEYKSAIEAMNKLLNPLFDELERCTEDEDHEFRKMFTVERNEKRQVIGVKRTPEYEEHLKKASSTALVVV